MCRRMMDRASERIRQFHSEEIDRAGGNASYTEVMYSDWRFGNTSSLRDYGFLGGGSLGTIQKPYPEEVAEIGPLQMVTETDTPNGVSTSQWIIRPRWLRSLRQQETAQPSQNK